MQARVLAIAKTPPAWLREQCEDYARRILPPWKARSEYLPQSRLHGRDDAKAAREDNARLLSAGKGLVRIAMDKSGTAYSSEGLAEWLQGFSVRGPLCFLLGGPFGMDVPTLDECDYVLSLSKLTLPHALAHLVLLEQLYRANSIVRKSGYHK